MPATTQPRDDRTPDRLTPLAAARIYLSRQWLPIPLPLGSKSPHLRCWQRLRLTEPDLAQHFGHNDVNIGVLLGEPSAGLIDVDLDAAGAIRLARKYLPETGLIHGRAGKSRSHYWYIANPIPSPIKFSDPDGTPLIELRSTGQQTLALP